MTGAETVPDCTPAVTPWFKSKTIQGAAWIFLSAVGGALVPMLQAKTIDWWSLGSVAVMALVIAGKRMFDPDVEGPVAMMNHNNVGQP